MNDTEFKWHDMPTKEFFQKIIEEDEFRYERCQELVNILFYWRKTKTYGSSHGCNRA